MYEIEDLREALNRPRVTCERCHVTYWEGWSHTCYLTAHPWYL